MDTKKKVFWSLFSVLLAVLTIWAGVSQGGKGTLIQIVEDVRNSDKGWLAAAVGCTCLFILLEGRALRCILDGIGIHRSFKRGFLYSTADIYFSAITPSATGGQPASAYFMVKDGIPAGTATVVLLVNLILYTLSIIVIGLAAVLAENSAFAGFRVLSRVLIITGFLVLSGLCVFFVLLVRRGHSVFDVLRKITAFLHRKKVIRREENAFRKLEEAQKEYDNCARMMQGKRKALIHAFFCNLAQRAAQVAVPMCLYLSFGGAAELAGRIFAMQGLVTIGYNFVPIPGAMGVADFLMMDAFTDLLGVEEALHLELISRGFTFYLCVAACGIITAIGYILLCRKEKGAGNLL